MALKLRRETVVDTLAGVAKKMAPEMKFYLVVLERTDKGTEFAIATSLEEKHQAWLLAQLAKQPPVEQPKAEEAPAAT